MTELNNNGVEILQAAKNSCQLRNSSRRRRLCSVVPPVLKVEHTEEGKRTVVVAENAFHPAQNIVKSTMPVRGCAERARSFCEHRGRLNSDSTHASPCRGFMPTNSLLRHYSLPRRVKGAEGADTSDTSCRAAFGAQKNTCTGTTKHGTTEFLSSGFLPANQKASNSDNFREAIGHPGLAINLSSCEKIGEKNRCLSVQRKTQRSMSAHSVALPGPDSSVLRDPATGTIYKRGRLLGKGGFAKVYEGLELSTNKKFALKIIDKSRFARVPQREKVDAEIELHSAASRAGHPNIAGFQTSFENARIICIVVELCERKSLAQHLRRKEFLGEAEVSDIVWQIVCGLAHVHGCGLIHRDLKLGNILLSGDKTVKIGDFGLATRVSWGKRKTICGTPNFIAPEVLQRQGHGPEADIWAVGCILYTLLVGKPPFETTSLKDTYKCILKNSYRIPSTVSQEAADLVRWMLRLKPSARPTVYDITKHAFFVKNQVEKRFPTLDELSKSYPSKVSSESFFPLRRKSVLPHITVQDGQLLSSNGTTCSQVRHNSCPFDPCSGYSVSSTGLKNIPTSSAGPKISINHINQAVLENDSCSSGSNTCVENVTPPQKECDHRTDDVTSTASLSKNVICKDTLALPKVLHGTGKCSPGVHEEQYCPEKALECVGVAKTPARKPKTNTIKAKKSPVKLLANKLQKLKLPSPKNCIKAAAENIKSKPSECKSAIGNPVIPTIVLSTETPQATWITKWVDYSNKYGFGYQLADGSICVLFNDGSHIALLPDSKTVEYTEPDGDATSTFVFLLQSPPNALLRFVKILQHFTLYMDKNLRRGSVAIAPKCDENKQRPRMLTWSRTSEHVAMYLSDGTLQVNFSADHSKVNVSNIHRRSGMVITYVDQNKKTTTYAGSELFNEADSGLRYRLQRVHEEFHLLLGSDGCSSHPFCSLLANNNKKDTGPGVLGRRDAVVTVS